MSAVSLSASWAGNKRWASLSPQAKFAALQNIRADVLLTYTDSSNAPNMHDPNPHKLTNAEWRELGNLTVIRESWGLQDEQDPLDLATLAYGAKFDFVSGSPGYVGEIFIFLGDSLGEPMVSRRDANGQLIEC
jgi:hypothetical protein